MKTSAKNSKLCRSLQKNYEICTRVRIKISWFSHGYRGEFWPACTLYRKLQVYESIFSWWVYTKIDGYASLQHAYRKCMLHMSEISRGVPYMYCACITDVYCFHDTIFQDLLTSFMCINFWKKWRAKIDVWRKTEIDPYNSLSIQLPVDLSFGEKN